MNWTDIVIIGIILISGWIGLKKGFIYSAFKLVSFIIAAIVSIKFYPVMAKFLTEKTPVYNGIKAAIMKNVLNSLNAQGNQAAAQAKDSAIDTVMKNLSVPQGLRSMFSGPNIDLTKLIDMNSIADAISTNLTDMVISIISVILLFFLVRLALLFVRIILEGVAKMPVISQANRLGGFVFGAAEGLLSIYIVCAILNVLFMANQLKWVSQEIDSSVIAKHFYQNNIILNVFKQEDKGNEA